MTRWLCERGMTSFVLLFIALANNDEIAVDPCLRLDTAWKDAKVPVEHHVYSTGGHGFSTRTQGLPVDSWIERLGDGLRVQGLLHIASEMVNKHVTNF